MDKLIINKILILLVWSILFIFLQIILAQASSAGASSSQDYTSHIGVKDNDKTDKAQATPDVSVGFFEVLKSPVVAYILFILGCYFIVVELTYFGVVFPGLVGIMCLLLGLYGLLDTNYNTYLALLLILVSIGLMAAEIHTPSYGVLLLIGFIVFLCGSYWLFYSVPMGVPWLVVGVFSSINLCFFGTIVYFFKKARSQKVVSGIDIMLGSMADVVEVRGKKLKVQIEGEVWQAELPRGIAMVGEKVKVVKVDGLILQVTKQDN